jgi:hypothetical protein
MYYLLMNEDEAGLELVTAAIRVAVGPAKAMLPMVG